MTKARQCTFTAGLLCSRSLFICIGYKIAFFRIFLEYKRYALPLYLDTFATY